LNAFVCAVGDWIMRYGVYFAAHLYFTTYWKQANKATNEHIKRATQILAKLGKASIDDPAEVKALCKQVVAVLHVQSVHLTMPLITEDKCLQHGHMLLHLVFFYYKPTRNSESLMLQIMQC